MNLEQLEKRIKILEDIEEIKKIQYRYINSLVKVQFSDIAECFAKEGVLDIHAGTAKGRKEILKLFTEKIALQHLGQEGEFCVHPLITVDGDKAKGSWLLYLQYAQPRKLKQGPGLLAVEKAPDWLQGFYEAEYVRENGEWKIARLKWRCRLMSPMQPDSDQSGAISK
jgi:hypothetical protein